MGNMELLIVRDRKISQKEIIGLCQSWFDDMFKVVVDIKRAIVCAGRDMHADAQELLIETGSKQTDLWGANIYPFRETKNLI